MPEPYETEYREVSQEVAQATCKFPAMRSVHEGYAIIKEELDELWEQVKKKPHDRDPNYLRREACQVAAMAIRFMSDCAPSTIPGPSRAKIDEALAAEKGLCQWVISYNLPPLTFRPNTLPLMDLQGWKRYGLSTAFVPFEPSKEGLADVIRQRNRVVALLDSLPPHELYQKYYSAFGDLCYRKAVAASEGNSK